MKKVYPGRKGLGPKIAVRDVTFAEERGVIFGLLGPNGAGKTTLINILTGLYESSAGEARLAGFDVKTETASVYNQIGVCPQFDILWEDLTIEEHLYFYARLKGVGRGNEAEAVERSLEQVSLTSLRKRLSKNLSGGEKRRLSIAIALVGDPAVVFLDEPTTGLDPEVRRLIWNIIQGARENKTIILTTHSMEEAEALCQRIGIMAKGSLRCVAQPLRLKE
ncbi:P-loop containing nucleoside triphosphate hydrolase protein, partial [Chytriomyces sp. MP71]